jgi:DNA-binding response OmpR family regulator
MHALIVEDEQPIREVIAAYMQRAGWEVEAVADGALAWQAFQKQKFDLAILDINVPGVDGIQLCKRIRAVSAIPILMVTARVEEMDEIIGLEVGADDYVKKPFSPSILMARVQALWRRSGEHLLEFDGIKLDPSRMEVTVNGEKVNLTTTQFNILYELARQPGRVFTREQILNRAYTDPLEHDVLERTVDAHIKSIRKMIEPDPANPQWILTVIGKGYKFNDQSS